MVAEIVHGAPYRFGDPARFSPAHGGKDQLLSRNSKIPALMDRSGPNPIRVFESGSILLHLAEKFGALLPTGGQARAECLSWLFWQMGSAYLGGGFGHFYAYAPTKIEYAIDRFAMEVKRQLDVLDRRLADNEYLSGGDYSIADIAVWPWYGGLAKGLLYGGGEFLSVQDYVNVQRWTDAVAKRPAVQRGRMVSRTWGEPANQLHERLMPAISKPGRRTSLAKAKPRPGREQQLAHHARHAQKSAKPHPAAAHRLAVQRVARKPLQASRNRDRAFEPRQRHAGALMRAGGEGEMPVRDAADVEGFGVFELPGIAVGGADAQRHRRAGFQNDARELDGLGGHAVAELVRAFVAQDFLDRGLDQDPDIWISRCFSAGCSDKATNPLPIKLVVVSWPALSRKIQL